MAEVSSLLDTPKRKDLQSQSTHLRAALKDFERTFAVENQGCKPSKNDIKANEEVAAKYKQYNRVRDVLSGKLDYEAFTAPPKPPSRKRGHERSDSGVSCTPKKKNNNHDATPRRTRQYSLDEASSPNPIVLLSKIGPTPQRDGKVLGLFDLLSNSAHSSKIAPSTVKRKPDTLVEEDADGTGYGIAAETPSRKRACVNGDLLDHLVGTPQTGRRKHSRTPVSEGRKFMLSQFFATPSTTRYADVDTEKLQQQPPLRTQVLGMTPENKIDTSQEPADATPAYLRRSTSFKDRLLSVSQSKGGLNRTFSSPPPSRTGPPTLRHLRSAPQLLNRLGLQSVNEEEDQDQDQDQDDDYEDELEALREIEDSQQPSAYEIQAQPQRTWKKRGQKRTTRRAVMRPTQGKAAQAPKFVAAEDASENEDGGVLQSNSIDVENHDVAPRKGRADIFDDEDSFSLDDSNDEDGENDEGHSNRISASKGKKDGKSSSKIPGQEKVKKKSGTINPNAVSHMNFRSLKIKNKNSKAKGRGRFRSGRR